jgi:23S rRNA (guanosine2251-2'-O)-methyltransferase
VARSILRMSDNLVWGARAVEEAIAAGGGVNRIYFASGVNVQRHDAIRDAARAADIRIETVPLAKLNHLTRSSDHQGVAAVLSPVRYEELKPWLARAPKHGVVLVLDRVQHARNLGMLIRSAAGAGALGVILPQRGGAMIDATVARASAGTVFHVPLVPVANLNQALRTLKAQDFWIYGLAAGGEQSLFEMDGLRPSVVKECDALLRIPLAKRVESLNAAVAGSVALFQAAQGAVRR